jgi:hypothetical protein
MQVVACNFPQPGLSIKFHFDDLHARHETDDQHPKHARHRRPAAMMAPVIILGAILVFVVWDTTERR